MIKFINNCWDKFKKAKLKFKLLIGLILVFYIFLIFVTTVSINVFSDKDFYMLTPGEISRVDNEIKINTIHSSGNVNTISVYEFKKISILQYWLSNSSYVNYIGEDYESYLSNKEQLVQGTIMKNTSITNSIIVAYNEAKKLNAEIEIDYDFLGLIVHQVSEGAPGDIKQSDIITAINGNTFINEIEFIALLEAAKVSDQLEVTVLRNEKEVVIPTRFYLNNNHKVIGISAYEHYKINSTTPSLEIHKNAATGPSGGFIQTLAIYNSLIAKDITKGKKLAGTGTISINGDVGAIGGVKQKVVTVNTYKADYMFVPNANYADAVAQYKLIKNPKIPQPIAISNFSDVIAFLEGVNN